MWWTGVDATGEKVGELAEYHNKGYTNWSEVSMGGGRTQGHRLGVVLRVRKR